MMMRAHLARPRRAAVVLLVALAACTEDMTAPSNPATETFDPSLNVNISAMTKMSDHLYIQDQVVGTGSEATPGKLLDVFYTGYLVNGSKFETNVGKTPISFTLGTQQVIQGWDIGIAGMKVGGKRRLVIGSALAYGDRANGQIPRNSTLIFDVELTAVRQP
jgi:FKBP-type peptidyl-prolyl cis-trans isomerase FkpA